MIVTRGTPMNIYIMLLFLAMPTCTFSMLSEEEMQKFVESYTMQEIPHNGKTSTRSMFYYPKDDQLIAAIDNSIVAFDCKTYESKTIFIGNSLQKIVLNPDKDVFYGKDNFGRSIFVGNLGRFQEYTCKQLEKLPLTGGELLYNVTNKQLYVCCRDLITILDRNGQTNSFTLPPIDCTRSMCCNKNILYTDSSMTNNQTNSLKHYLEKWSTSGTFITKADTGSPISTILCDQTSGNIFFTNCRNGCIQQCDANLENQREIRYEDRFVHQQTLVQDSFSKLLCITTTVTEGSADVHFLHPDNQTARLTIPLPLVPKSTACDPATGTFFVGTPSKILVFKPKQLYLALLNQSAYTNK